MPSKTPTKKHSLISEYLEYQIEYEKKYGKNTIVLEEVGKFFEFYGVNNETEKIGNVRKISELLNIQMTRRNKNILENNRTNCLMAGFPTASLKRFLQKLIDANYTVVLIEQVTPPPNPKREITNIYSPSTYIDNMNTHISNNLLSIYLEVETDYKNKRDIYIFGLSVINISTGYCVVYETDYIDGHTSSIYEDVYRFIETYNPAEIIINTRNFDKTNDELLKIINVTERSCHISINDVPSDMYKLSYQNGFISRIFKNHKMGFLSPIEYINLERSQYALMSYLLLINFAFEHNSKIVTALDIPNYWNTTKYLKLHHNTLYQLNIVNTNASYKSSNTQFKSLYDVINKTSTSMGRRLLREHLLNPIVDSDKLCRRYSLITNMIESKKMVELEKNLNNIIDIERLHRKMRINMIHPCELYSLYTTYQNISDVISICLDDETSLIVKDYGLSRDDISEYNSYIKEIESIFITDNLSKYQLNNITETLYNTGVNDRADELQNKINTTYDKINEMVAMFNSKINETSSVKMKYTDRDGYMIVLTNSKAKLIKSKLSAAEKKLYTFRRKTSSEQMIVSDKMSRLSDDILITETKCRRVMKDIFVEKCSELCGKYSHIMKKISDFISNVDLIKSHAKVSLKYGYCCPEIKPINDDTISNSTPTTIKSYIYSKSMRHPIIERNQKDIEYIPNDVDIGRKDKGIVLFGINGSGKSCYMKAIGMNLILAQMGMFVAAKNFEFSPYTNIFTRISGDDNIFRGLSSFAVEMTELRTIINKANDRSLVIGDEVCRGTEEISALAIVATTIRHFQKNDINFIFTSHLHKLTEIVDNVSYFHLSVDIENNTIIYTRKITNGSGITKYGLEVASFLIKNDSFVKEAYSIRNELLNEPDKILSDKKSKYNSDVYVHSCSICDKTYKETQLDVHHIKYQSECDENDRYEHIPKNFNCNLVVLCKEHHIQVHQNKIKIHGYDYTSNGVVLNYDMLVD